MNVSNDNERCGNNDDNVSELSVRSITQEKCVTAVSTAKCLCFKMGCGNRQSISKKEWLKQLCRKEALGIGLTQEEMDALYVKYDAPSLESFPENDMGVGNDDNDGDSGQGHLAKKKQQRIMKKKRKVDRNDDKQGRPFRRWRDDRLRSLAAELEERSPVHATMRRSLAEKRHVAWQWDRDATRRLLLEGGEGKRRYLSLSSPTSFLFLPPSSSLLPPPPPIPPPRLP